VTGNVMRTVYDGFSFDVIREGETFRDSSLTTRYSATTRSSVGIPQDTATGERYRWLGDSGQVRTVTEDGYTIQGERFGTRGVTLYARGEAVAVSYSSSASSRSVYLGKDIMGSVRSATTDTDMLDSRYEYDVFGTPYKGDLSGGMNLGYMSKPFETSTGLYNYGFRDYKPQAARFTTVDPIRDGNNWFLYVNNDPVNYIDIWGLQGVPLIIYNIDPTPGSNSIISTSGEVGHTWLSVDGNHMGWGHSSGDPTTGATVPGTTLNTESSNVDGRTVTSTYEKTITTEQATVITNYFNNLESAGTGYNLGGSSADPNATMCTEAVVNALNASGALTPAESAIINAPYPPWGNSFPDLSTLPPDLQALAPGFENLTAPNPNEFENRMIELNQLNNQNRKNH